MSKLVSREMIEELKRFIVKNIEYEDIESDRDEALSPSPRFAGASFDFSVADVLKRLLSQKERSFSEELNELVTKSGKSNVEIYTAAQMDRRLFSKICNKPDYRPTKLTALALAIALELTLDQTKQFISRAGYALTHSSVTDLVVEFFISKGIYNVQAINEALYELDQPLLGNALA